MVTPILAADSDGSFPTKVSSFALPSINPPGDDIVLYAIVSVTQPDRPIVAPAGWDLVEDRTIPGETLGIYRKEVPTADGPYDDVFGCTGGTSYIAAIQLAFRTTGAPAPGNSALNSDTFACVTNPTSSVDLPTPPTDGNLVLGFAALSGCGEPYTGSLDWDYSAGWHQIFTEESVGLACAYRVANGTPGEDTFEATRNQSNIAELAVVIVEDVLLAEPVLPPAGWDVFAADNLTGQRIATLEHAKGRYIRSALNDLGEGGFVVNRHTAEATEEILAEGNLVKVYIPDCSSEYIDGFFLGADGDYTLLAVQGGQGKEDLSFRGPGALDYLDRARMTPCAFSLESTVKTWTKIWSKSMANPSGATLDPNDSDYVYVIGRDRRVRRIRIADHVTVSTSPPLWSGSDKWAAGLSMDPSDNTILWALEAPWLSGSSANTKIRKVRISDWAIVATLDLGSAIKHTDVEADASALWLSRYDGTNTLYKRSKTTGNNVGSSPFSVSYKGTTQTKATGLSVNGSELALWYAGTKRALIVDTSAPTTVTTTISTRTISSFGGGWFTVGGDDFFIMVSSDSDTVWLYQLTDQVPQCVDGSGVFHPEQQAPGALAWRVLVEITHADRPDQPCPELSYDFTEDEDSNGTPWPARTSTEEFTWRVGDRAYSDVLSRLIPAGVIFDLDVNTMTLHAYVASSYGTDRTSGTFASNKVRFEQGVNLGVNGDFAKRDNRGQPATNIVVAGDNGVFGAADLAGRYVREGFMAVSGPTTEAVLDAIGDDELARQRLVSQAAGFETLWADNEAAGRYIPKRHYWKGDLVTVDMEPGEFTYQEAELRVYGTLITERDGGWRAALDLGSAYKLPPPVTSVPGDSSGSSDAGGGGAKPGGSTTVVLNPSLTVTDGGDIVIPTVTRIEAEGAYSPSPGVAVIPRGGTGAEVPYIEELLTDETDTTLVLAPDGLGGVEFRPVGTVTVVGSVTPDAGSPVTISAGSTHRAFPGVVWLDNHQAAEHIVGDRFLVIYRNGTDHDFSHDGKAVGRICTITDATTWTFSIGSEFTIEDLADDVRPAMPSIIDIDGAGDFRIILPATEYDGTANHDLHVLVSDDAPEDFVSGGTWTRYEVNLTAGANENLASGRVVRLQSGSYLMPGYWISGATQTTGVLLIGDITDPATHTVVPIASGYNEIYVVQQDGGRLDAHIRNAAHTFHYHSHSSDDGSSWSAPSSLYAAGGLPMWKVLTSGVGLTVYRAVPTPTISDWDTAYRQTTSGAADSGWGSETILDATSGYHSAYADILQLDDNHALVVEAMEIDTGVITDSDIYAWVFNDSTVYGPAQAGLVAVSAGDTTPDYLEDKLVAGTGVTLTKLGAGGDEELEISVTPGASDLDDLTDVAITSPAAAEFLRYSGSAWLNAALAVADYPFHDEVLCDSAGPILDSHGDVIMVTGVPN